MVWCRIKNGGKKSLPLNLPCHSIPVSLCFSILSSLSLITKKLIRRSAYPPTPRNPAHFSLSSSFPALFHLTSATVSALCQWADGCAWFVALQVMRGPGDAWRSRPRSKQPVQKATEVTGGHGGLGADLTSPLCGRRRPSLRRSVCQAGGLSVFSSTSWSPAVTVVRCARTERRLGKWLAPKPGSTEGHSVGLNFCAFSWVVSISQMPNPT